MSNKSGVVFETPPTVRRTTVDHQSVAAALRRRPGRWARVGTYATRGGASSTAYAIRRGRLPSYAPEGAYEATSRETDAGTFIVHARYMGTAVAEKTAA